MKTVNYKKFIIGELICRAYLNLINLVGWYLGV